MPSAVLLLPARLGITKTTTQTVNKLLNKHCSVLQKKSINQAGKIAGDDFLDKRKTDQTSIKFSKIRNFCPFISSIFYSRTNAPSVLPNAKLLFSVLDYRSKSGLSQ